MNFKSLSNDHFYDYGVAVGAVRDWWVVSGEAHNDPKGFAPFEAEWKRVRTEIYRRDMQDQFQL